MFHRKFGIFFAEKVVRLVSSSSIIIFTKFWRAFSELASNKHTNIHICLGFFFLWDILRTASYGSRKRQEHNLERFFSPNQKNGESVLFEYIIPFVSI